MDILNFASYKNPGGMFIKGSSAQEESLCHISNLYNHLVKEKHYYDINNTKKNKALYEDRAIIHRNVMFEINLDNNPIIQACNIVTCAAPNLSAAMKYQGISKSEGDECMRNRIKFLSTYAGL